MERPEQLSRPQRLPRRRRRWHSSDSFGYSDDSDDGIDAGSSRSAVRAQEFPGLPLPTDPRKKVRCWLSCEVHRRSQEAWQALGLL